MRRILYSIVLEHCILVLPFLLFLLSDKEKRYSSDQTVLIVLKRYKRPCCLSSLSVHFVSIHSRSFRGWVTPKTFIQLLWLTFTMAGMVPPPVDPYEQSSGSGRTVFLPSESRFSVGELELDYKKRWKSTPQYGD